MKKKVVIIEDDTWFAQTVAHILQKSGWKVSLAKSGSKGIDLIDEVSPDVVLLDMMLPEVAAPALLNELQSYTDLAQLPIVLCTSMDMTQFSPDVLSSYGIRSVIDKSKHKPQDIVEALEYAIQQD